MATPPTATFLVGWIAALSHELAAARSMLDEEWKRAPSDFSPPASDTNTYKWGRIADHNVVITALPEGRYGTSAAAEVATQLTASLPNVRFGLMVGIGAGVSEGPEGEDIRLGDVVVSRPEGTLGGVVQYDLLKAKEEKGERFDVRTGFLSMPPQSLLAALASWRSTEGMGDSDIRAILAKAFQRKPRMEQEQGYGYPGAKSDPLRRDASSIRSEDPRCNSPRIRFGTIASGNKLIKSADERDQIVKWLGNEGIKPICFEMEAAGLMVRFPSLVIRGICDYADKDKSDVWQRYAAMTAAAFAKELLLELEPRSVQAEKGLREQLEHIQGSIQQLDSKLTQFTINENLKKVLDWISAVDYATQLDDHKRRHQSGTAQWFLEHPKYTAWTQSQSLATNILFCPGDRGTGKTVIASLVVQHLLDSVNQVEHPVMYVFLDHKQRDIQTCDHVLSTMLRQLVFALQAIPGHVVQMHESHSTKNTRPSFEELKYALTSALAQTLGGYVVLDGLDEATASTVKASINTLRQIVSESKLCVLATARHIPDTEALFPHDQRIEIKASPQDLVSYARRRIDADFRDYIKNEALVVESIVARVVAIAGTIFLLVRLVMDDLATKDNIADLRGVLEDIPLGTEALDYMYKAALERIQSQPREHAKRACEALLWVIRGQRLLKCAELEHALAFSQDDTEFDPERITPIDVLISHCAGLLTIDKESNAVRVIHFTTQTFLENCMPHWFPASPDLLLTCKCLNYLIMFDTDAQRLIEEQLAGHPRRNNVVSIWKVVDSLELPCPLYFHAMSTWPLSTSIIDGKNDIAEISMLVKFIQRLGAASAALNCTIGTSYDYHWYYQIAQATIWHVLAMANLPSTLLALRDIMPYSGVPDSEGSTPFALAARLGNSEMVTLLLQQKLADIFHVDNEGRTPLALATMNGHAETVSILIRARKAREKYLEARRETSQAPTTTENWPHKARIWNIPRTFWKSRVLRGNSRLTGPTQERRPFSGDRYDYDLGEAFVSAASGGYHGILDILLKTGEVNVNHKHHGYKTTALHAAASRGHGDAVRFLLGQPDIDVNIPCALAQTALTQALFRSHCPSPYYKGDFDVVVRALIMQGRANVGTKDLDGSTPLLEAARAGRIDWCQLILNALDGSKSRRTAEIQYAHAVNFIQTKAWHAIRSQIIQTTLAMLDSTLEDSDLRLQLRAMTPEHPRGMSHMLTDRITCRSCRAHILHQGYLCSSCEQHCKILSQYEAYVCLKCASIPGQPLDLALRQPLTWVDARPLLEHRFADFTLPQQADVTERWCNRCVVGQHDSESWSANGAEQHGSESWSANRAESDDYIDTQCADEDFLDGCQSDT